MSYLEYRKNKRIAKQEMTKLAATTLPLINEITEKNTDIVQFVLDLVNTCKGLGSEELVNKVLNEMALLLESTQPRLLEILTYLAGMSPEDIQKVLVHAVVHSNKKLEDK